MPTRPAVDETTRHEDGEPDEHEQHDGAEADHLPGGRLFAHVADVLRGAMARHGGGFRERLRTVLLAVDRVEDVPPCLVGGGRHHRVRGGVLASGESVCAGAAAQRARRGVMHVLDEKLMYFGGRLESFSCIPRANERPFDDLGRERHRVPEIGTRFLRERLVLREKGAVK
jgi:hypothetical protein